MILLKMKRFLKRARDISSYYDELINLTNLYHMFGEGTHQIKGKTVEVTLRKLKNSFTYA